MTQKPPHRRGLGRGLGALIPTQVPVADESTQSEDSSPATAATAEPGRGGAALSGATAEVEPEGKGPGATAADGGAHLAPVDGAYFAELDLDSITPNPRQPRQVFDEEAMAELVHSIGEVGLLQPVVVRPLRGEGVQPGADAGSRPRFELVMGERRWRASQQAGQATIPAIVRETGDDDLLRDALLENLHRAELNPLEEAAAYGQLLEDFDCTHEELAQRIGRSRPQITNTLRLLRLSPAVQRRVGAGVLSAGHARALLAVEDPDIQGRLAQRVVSEGISVRGLEEIVAVGETSGARKVRRSRPTAPGLADIESRLADRLDTRVRVTLGKSRGKVAIDFASLDDLERIIGIIDPRNREDRPI